MSGSTTTSRARATRTERHMAVIENQTMVACTPEELFDYCVDLRNELEWNPSAR